HYFNILWPQGVTEVNTFPGMSVYPNPAGAQLTVTFSGIAEAKGTLLLVDMMGRVVLRQAVNNVSTVVNTSGITNGIYTIVYKGVDGDDAKLQSRVVIAR
ncbi:MAG: T9SS type A sorting domain-containing protein, partial [Taibaiella sp.]|nr:T9SS type A sorting domain-containing protein [Taibaiella sp.]